MKKLSALMVVACLITACGNDHGETGVINDGMSTIDSDGALVDSLKGKTITPQTDTAIGEDRVDVQPRNTPQPKDTPAPIKR